MVRVCEFECERFVSDRTAYVRREPRVLPVWC